MAVTMRGVGRAVGLLLLLEILLLTFLVLVAGPAHSEQGGARFQVTVQIVPNCVRRFDFSVTRQAVTPALAADAVGECPLGRDVAAHLQADAASGVPLAADAAVRVGIADLETGKRITTTTEMPAGPPAAAQIWRLSLDF